MNKYQETELCDYCFEGMIIPNSESNRHYSQMLEEIEKGKAEIIPFIKDKLTSVQVRDKALEDIENYNFGDGRVIQVRLIDRDNLKGGIEKGTNVWKMLDNKVYSVTTAELQAALDDQESRISKIWMAHFADLEVGKAKKGK